jgi:hypothetical protein
MPDVEHTTGSCFVQPYPTGVVIRRRRRIGSSRPFFSCVSESLVYGFHANGCRGRAGRKDMPRSVANIFGMVMVVLSIGFNIWRYPIVWKMAGPATAGASEMSHPATTPESAPAAQPAKPAAVEPERAASPPTLATQSEPKPAADAGAKSAVVAAPVNASPPIHVEPVAAVAEKAAPISPSPAKPLVPVPKMVAKAAAVGAGAVRRLPPVDESQPQPTAMYASGATGAIPIYPSTGIK